MKIIEYINEHPYCFCSDIDTLLNIESSSTLRGRYTLEEFIKLWKQINGKWYPDLVVYVIDFELAYSDLYVDDKFVLSEECLEYQIRGDISWKVLSKP